MLRLTCALNPPVNREVAQLVATGVSDKEIATNHLHFSERSRLLNSGSQVTQFLRFPREEDDSVQALYGVLEPTTYRIEFTFRESARSRAPCKPFTRRSLT